MMDYILLGIFAFVILIVISIYNTLVRKRNFYKNAYSQIDVQLQRRYDLIPNLVETAKGFMKHEQETLEKVIQARNQAQQISINVKDNPGNPEMMAQLAAAENSLTKSMGSFFALAESYPDLKANTNMSQLMEELTSTENKISFSRQAFNDSITDYNNQRETFPSSIIANSFGFGPAKLLDIETPEARKAVKVSF